MTRKQLQQILPVLTAFAEGRLIQFRDMRPGALSHDWVTVNPDTTEFRLNEPIDPDEWRVKPDQPERRL